MTPTTPYDLTLHSHQKAFLRHCRRNPKPLPILLRDRRIEPATLERWRTDPAFERAFQRSVRHLTRDTTTELRLALSVAMSLISSEITTLHKALLDETLTKESELTLPPRRPQTLLRLHQTRGHPPLPQAFQQTPQTLQGPRRPPAPPEGTPGTPTQNPPHPLHHRPRRNRSPLTARPPRPPRSPQRHSHWRGQLR